jgi:chorismate mutase
LSPDDAWSDAAQQITPQTLMDLLKNIKIRTQSTDDLVVNDELKHLRTIIDSIDEELLGVIAKRMKAIEKIGNYKKQHNVAIFQPDRLAEIIKTRKQFGDNLQLDSDFIEKLLLELHSESIRYQTEIVYKPTLE